MKKRNIALIMSAAVFAAVTLFVGCSDKNSSDNISEAEETASEISDTEEQETQPDPMESKNNSQNTTEHEESRTAPETEAVTNVADVSTPGSELALLPKYETDENGAVIFDETESAGDSELIEAAQVLFDSACRTSWDFHVGCPYSLNYGSFVENDFGWQYFLVTSSGINSIADVENDYYKIFSREYESDLSEIYMESGGRVYALDGVRGMNTYYIGSKITSVSRRSENEIFFTVENYYSGDDYIGNEEYTETEEFSAVLSDDGSWRAGVFRLPY